MSHLPTSAASRLALSGALARGFVAVLVFALIALVATFFLKEERAGAMQEGSEAEREAEVCEEEAESALEVVSA